IGCAPHNAVLILDGDLESTETRSTVEIYFTSIPRQPDRPGVDVSEPTEVAQRQETYNDPHAPAPAFVIGWKLPPRRTTDFYPLSLAFDLLVEGESSRLYQKLVKGEESVVQIQGGIDERRGPSAGFIVALPKPGTEVGQIRQTIMSEIERLATEGP